ncbi:MAG TPA: MBL fold metallo-hydrolase [Gemmatimonadaceae bacterium]|nr:MBL fold metallo-hydrolase [Gemmatimonadaceae bacterium]
MIDRRTFVATTVGMLAASSRLARLEARQDGRTRLILLGTGGGPLPRKSVAPSSQVIVANDAAYVVDCGDGVARQMVSAGIAPRALRHIFITHHHSDHNADYGNLMLLAWASGLRTRVDGWGPPPIERMTKLFLEMSAPDISVRMADEQHPPLAPLIHAHDVTRAGVVMTDANLKVTAARVTHPLVEHALAYRFDAPDRSIVISGDTTASDSLIELARGADVLVHEAMYLPAIDRIAARIPSAARLKEHLVNSHTSAEDAGRVAQAAGVKQLVLSHLVPADDPLVTDQMWIDAARSHFRGVVTVGKDLLEI